MYRKIDICLVWSRRMSNSAKALCLGLAAVFAPGLRGAEPLPSHISPDDSVKVHKVYFRKASDVIVPWFDDNRARIDSLKLWLEGLDASRIIDCKLIGSASPEGEESYNLQLAGRRARALASLVGSNSSLTPEIASVIDYDVVPSHWPQARYAALSVKFRPVDRKAEEQLENAVIPETHTNVRQPIGKDAMVAGDSCMAVADTCVSGNFVAGLQSAVVTDYDPDANAGTSQSPAPPILAFINTNLLYDLAFTPNIGIGVYLGKKFTLYADWMYARWHNHAKRKYWHIWGGDVELRRQFGHGRSNNVFAGHYLGIYASMVRYDFQFGVDRTGVLTDKFNYAAGISYGYSLPLGRRINLDFSIGLGYAWGSYKKHHKVDEHDVWISTHKRSWFGPTRAGISLTWLIGAGNVNLRKEGVRK